MLLRTTYFNTVIIVVGCTHNIIYFFVVYKPVYDVETLGKELNLLRQNIPIKLLTVEYLNLFDRVETEVL